MESELARTVTSQLSENQRSVISELKRTGSRDFVVTRGGGKGAWYLIDPATKTPQPNFPLLSDHELLGLANAGVIEGISDKSVEATVRLTQFGERVSGFLH